MTAAPPLLFLYAGDGAWSPAHESVAKRADEHYVVGAIYPLVEHNSRSAVSHSHYFAKVNEYWQTLPEALADEYPTPEHLRKKALIRAGYADERSIVCASKAEALKIGAFIRPMDEYAIVEVRERVVRVYTARSQSYAGMNHEEFQKSKEAVLQFIDDLLLRSRECAA